jgi:hypothetical protein
MPMNKAHRNPSPTATAQAEFAGRRSGPMPLPMKEQEPRFSLSTLMLIITAVGVALGAIRMLGWPASAVLFVLAVATTNYGYPRWRPQNVSQQILLFDVVWGILMPTMCLALDPIVFSDTPYWNSERVFAIGNSTVTNLGYVAYPVLGVQIGLLLAWLVWKPNWTPLRTIFNGSFMLGSILGLIIGVLLLPLTLIGTGVFGLGLAGFTPFFTSYVFSRRAKEAANTRARFDFLPGARVVAVFAFILPVIAGSFVLWLVRGSNLAVDVFRR